ncbi:copper amine oxidase N-terminal domain-containing protein [Paenibacillus lemnae]|uniref:Copper amine oxidase N-terminal domain-containing protein n=2 Tax=Paenibacillus lemnae TaxID=1330551 RepID=A0A848M2Q4_PAELE|nr:copper amine oxidase N-terminal domain-containing protein [Paenibacillus lemnae]
MRILGTGILAIAIAAAGPLHQTVHGDISSNTSTNVTVMESSYALEGGKMRVRFDVRNGGSGTEAGFVVLGYDASGKVIEAIGDSAYLMSNEIETFEVDLDAGSLVNKVEVKPAGQAGDRAVLLASGHYEQNGKIEVTAVLQNADSGRNAGVLAVGYDASGKAVEVKSASGYLMSSNVDTFSIQLKAAKQIKSVKVTAVDTPEDAVKLLSTGSRLENGKLIVSGAIQNRNEGGRVGVIIVGSQASGKVLEVNTTSGYLSGKEIGNFEAELTAGKAISGVKVYLTGGSQTPKIIAEGRTRINNKLVVSVGIENGDKSQKITMKSSAYNAQGRLLGSDIDSIYMTAHEATTLRIDYLDSRVASVKLKYFDEAGQEIGAVPIRIKINGQLQSYAQAPVMVNGSVMVPMRPIFESLQASVKWNQQTQTVTSTKGSTKIQLKLGSKQATVNQKSVKLGTAPRSVKGTTMVPLRFVADALGCDVKWDKEQQMVLITTK